MVDAVIEDTEELEKKESPEDQRAFMRRWVKEIAIADHAESKWREKAEKIYHLYEAGEREAENDLPAGEQSFNILWSNTETLLPAVYNSTPMPDVRRRFRDDDPVGKAAAMVLERSIAYAIDTEDFDDTLEDGALDALLGGRGLARVKYDPVFIPQMLPPAAPGAEPLPRMDPLTNKPMQEKATERTFTEHVQWDDFLRGPGKRWSDLPWIGFRHRLTYDALVKMFGEDMAKNVPLTYPDILGKSDKDEEKMAFATAEVIEVWDKESFKVFFISMGYKEAPLSIQDDPMELQGFWPVPKPLYAIRNSRSLVPRAPFQMYKAKAMELERISRRINSAVRVCRLRGIYDSTMAEVKKLLEAGDTEMIPVENAARYYGQPGGIEKAIWMLPTQAVAAVLTTLYLAQNECKQTIFEITGLSDVVRGATNPNETATAQRYKAQFGGIRLKALQRRIKRFGRDLMRLMADVMCSKYDQQTFAAITGLIFPTGEEKAAAQAQLQQLQMQAQQQAQMQAQMQAMQPAGAPPAGPPGMPPQGAAPPGMPPMQPGMPPQGMPPPPPPIDPALEKTANSVSWDEIMAVLRSDKQRCNKVDVETDSTVAETLDTDMEGLQQVLTALVGFIGQALPLVQSGILTMDGLKSVALQIVRRARMGSAVEDAVEGMKEPPPPPPPQPGEPPKDPSADIAKAVADAVKQILEQIKKPKKLEAKVAMDGSVEGVVDDA